MQTDDDTSTTVVSSVTEHDLATRSLTVRLTIMLPC